jgi:hypothetical protein
MSYRALIFVALLAGTAHAENWEAAYGLGGGGEAIGGDFYGGGIVHAHVERRVIDRLAVSITGELAGAADYNTPTRRAGIYRGLAGVDITVFAREGTFMPRIMTSIGTGTETIMWDRGTLTRSTSYVAVEYRSGFSLKDSDFFRGIDSMAFRFGVRGQVAPGVSGTTVAKLCTACEAMEPADPAVDFGFAFYMGLVFGR